MCFCLLKKKSIKKCITFNIIQQLVREKRMEAVVTGLGVTHLGQIDQIDHDLDHVVPHLPL